MIGSLQYRSHTFIRLLIAIFTISCVIFLSACNNAEEVTDESTLGSNDAAVPNDDKIERNSMDDVADTRTDSESSDNQDVGATTTDQ